jgi:hypothetical protein
MLTFIAEHSREEASALVRPAGETLTYGGLAMAAAAVAQALEARVGDVARRAVAIVASDGAQRLAALLAVLEAGGVALPLDERRGLEAVRATAERARAVALVVGDAAEDRLDIETGDAARVAQPLDTALLLAPLVGAGEARRFSRAALADAADALVPAQSFTTATRLGLLDVGVTPAQLVGQALATLRAGGTLLDVGRLDPVAQLAALARLDGNTLLGFPAQLDALARAVLDHGVPPPPITRVMVQASWLREPLRQALQQAFPQATLVNLHRSADSLHFTPGPAPEPVDGTIELEGERLHPTVLEAELRAREEVREAAVLVVPDERLGARLYAFVALADATARLTLTTARVMTLESLPHAPDGSIDYQALQRMASPE